MKRLMLLSLVLIISLVLAAVTPGMVYAEGDIPEAPPTEPELAAETQPEDVGSAVELLAESGAVIAAPDGAAVPLASQTALNLLCVPDPWFYGACPGGKCTGYDFINQALAEWAAKKGYGYIYLEGGFDRNQDVFIDGRNTGMNTLKGIVWDKTTPGVKPIVRGAMDIHHFTTGFTLQGFSKTANASKAIYFHDNSGLIKLVDVSVSNPGGTGIYIYPHKGVISLINVNANDNLYAGLSLDNSYWVDGKYVNAGNVTITNSAFLRNGGAGNGINYAGLSVTS